MNSLNSQRKKFQKKVIKVFKIKLEKHPKKLKILKYILSDTKDYPEIECAFLDLYALSHLSVMKL